MRHTMPWSKRPVIISGPSGCGKSTLLKMLFEKHGDQLGYCVSRECFHAYMYLFLLFYVVVADLF